MENQTRAPGEPRKMTPAQNVIMTVKLLAVIGAVIATLWGLNLLVSQ
jgi:hypothetical protein